MRTGLRFVLGAVCTAAQMANVAAAGSVTQARIPAMHGGVMFACSDPNSVLAVVRGKDSTQVIHSGPNGVDWRENLPPIPAERYNESFISPDGSAAVVGNSGSRGNAWRYLVSKNFDRVRIDGFSLGVDFQPGKMLITTSDGNSKRATRVRIYELAGGRLLSDTTFTDKFEASVDNPMSVRLTRDGRAYYYVTLTADNIERLVIRDAATGKEIGPGAIRSDHNLPPSYFEDVLLFSPEHGYLSLGGKVHVITSSGLSKAPVFVPAEVGGVTDFIEGGNGQYQVMKGAGWGVLDLKANHWTLVQPSKAAGQPQWSPDGMLTEYRQSAFVEPELVTYYFGSEEPKIVRRISAPSAATQEVMCNNTYGFIRYQAAGATDGDADFKWVGNRPLPVR